MTESNDPQLTATLPVYARVTAYLTEQVGLPSILAIAFFYVIVTQVLGNQAAAAAEHKKMSDTLTMIQAEFQLFDQTQSETNRATVQLLLLQCVHGAKSDAERSECLSVTAQKVGVR